MVTRDFGMSFFGRRPFDKDAGKETDCEKPGFMGGKMKS
jgi:hypothetical protein